MMPPEPVPKKVRPVLDELGIRGVVGGYTSRTARGAVFTCWNKSGACVCVLVKKPGDAKWRLTLTAKQKEAACRAVPGLTGNELDQAMDEYGAWHLPTLIIEHQKTKEELERVNPEGGMAWSLVRKMAAAIAVRQTRE